MIIKPLKSVILATIVIALIGVANAANMSIALVVGDRATSTSDLEDRVKIAMFSAGLPNKQEVANEMLPQMIQLLIDESLIAIDAESFNLKVTSDEIREAIYRIEEKNGMKYGTFGDYLRSRGLNYDAFKTQIEGQLLRNKLMSARVRPTIVITDREVHEKSEQLSNSSGFAELDISEIVLPFDDSDQEQKMRNVAQNIVKQLNDEANFNAVAKEFSRGESASQGGALGWIREDQLDQEVRNRLASMVVGQFSDPIKLNGKYYIIKLNDRRALIIPGLDESEVGIKQVFLPYGKKATELGKDKWIDELSQEAKKHKGCRGFNKFAKAVGMKDTPTKVMSQLKDIKDNIRQVVISTPVGGITKPIKTPAGVIFVAVCESTKAVPSLADKDKIRDVIFREKMQLAVQRYLRKLRQDNYIEVKIY